jgi:hypothetical protein
MMPLHAPSHADHSSASSFIAGAHSVRDEDDANVLSRASGAVYLAS